MSILIQFLNLLGMFNNNTNSYDTSMPPPTAAWPLPAGSSMFSPNGFASSFYPPASFTAPTGQPVPPNVATLTPQAAFQTVADLFRQNSTHAATTIQPIIITPAGFQVTDGDGEGSIVSEVVLVLGGTLVVLHYFDRMVRALYYQASYASDERVVGAGIREEGWPTTIWRWVGSGLLRFWIPLWAGHEAIRDRAVRDAVDDAYVDIRLRNLEHVREQQQLRILERAQAAADRNPRVPQDDLNDWRDEIRRQRGMPPPYLSGDQGLRQR